MGGMVLGSNPAGMRFSAPVHTGPWVHPPFYATGTRSFPGVKRLGRGIVHPPPSSAKVKERRELHLYSTTGSSSPVLGQTFQRISMNFNGQRSDQSHYRPGVKTHTHTHTHTHRLEDAEIILHSACVQYTL